MISIYALLPYMPLVTLPVRLGAFYPFKLFAFMPLCLLCHWLHSAQLYWLHSAQLCSHSLCLYAFVHFMPISLLCHWLHSVQLYSHSHFALCLLAFHALLAFYVFLPDMHLCSFTLYAFKASNASKTFIANLAFQSNLMNPAGVVTYLPYYCTMPCHTASGKTMPSRV